MQVIAVQLNPTWENKPVNHNRVRQILDEQEISARSLIILPEMFDTGFSMNVAATAQDESRASETFLKDVAKQYNAAVLAGVVGPVVDGQGLNEAVAFAPDGSELVRYRKLQPFSPAGEDQHYGFGQSHRIFTWEDVQISPFVCYDLRFPEVFRPAAVAGAELITLIACWPAKRSEHWVRLLQARAIENQAYTIGVNRCGDDPQFHYDGRSAAFDPHGEQIFEADGAEQVLRCEVDAAKVREWRAAFRALKDMRYM